MHPVRVNGSEVGREIVLNLYLSQAKRRKSISETSQCRGPIGMVVARQGRGIADAGWAFSG
jgi:hypothetical protein